MNVPSSGAWSPRQVGPVYMVKNGEMMIDAPIKKVWHYVINYTLWQNFPTAQHVSGETGQEGELVLLRKDETGFSFPPYYARTILLDPERRAIWKTYPEKGTQDVEFFGIVDFRVNEIQGTTCFSYNSLYEFLVPYRYESELDAYRKQQSENFDSLFAIVLPKLKEVAEKDA